MHLIIMTSSFDVVGSYIDLFSMVHIPVDQEIYVVENCAVI